MDFTTNHLISHLQTLGKKNDKKHLSDLVRYAIISEKRKTRHFAIIVRQICEEKSRTMEDSNRSYIISYKQKFDILIILDNH